MTREKIIQTLAGRIRPEFIEKVADIAGKYYEDPLTIDESEWIFLRRIAVTNGCGPRGCKICKFLSKRLFRKGTRQRFCDIHDFGHFLGGDEYERMRQNHGLYYHTITDIGNERISFTETLYYTVIALAFLLMTNSFSYKYFHYHR